MASEQVKAIDGLYKVTKWIEDRGLKRAAVTNAPRANAELMVSILGLSEFFEVLIIGGECEHAKPYPDPYLKALEVLNVSKDHTFVFEVCHVLTFFLPQIKNVFIESSENDLLFLFCLARILFRE